MCAIIFVQFVLGNS